MSNPRSTGRTRGRRTVVIAAVVGVLAAAALTAFIGQGVAGAKSTQAAWLDASQPIQARVNALLGAMTLPEKVGQMDQQLVDNLSGPSA